MDVALNETGFSGSEFPNDENFKQELATVSLAAVAAA